MALTPTNGYVYFERPDSPEEHLEADNSNARRIFDTPDWNGRLNIAQEMLGWSVVWTGGVGAGTISVAGNEQFESWRERDHDDLVLATALACWWGEKNKPVESFVPYRAGTGNILDSAHIPGVARAKLHEWRDGKFQHVQE